MTGFGKATLQLQNKKVTVEKINISVFPLSTNRSIGGEMYINERVITCHKK
jgi:hypothetical protein